VPAKKTGLGKGFESLIPGNFDRELIIDGQDRVQRVALEDLSPNPDQPRSVFNEQELAGLAESINDMAYFSPLLRRQ
jgi:ParB family chromosome partitioning protein